MLTAFLIRFTFIILIAYYCYHFYHSYHHHYHYWYYHIIFINAITIIIIAIIIIIFGIIFTTIFCLIIILVIFYHYYYYSFIINNIISSQSPALASPSRSAALTDSSGAKRDIPGTNFYHRNEPDATVSPSGGCLIASLGRVEQDILGNILRRVIITYR